MSDGIQVLHYMVVGDITEKAKMRIKNNSGFVRKLDIGPLPVYLIAIRCDVIPNHGPRATEVVYHTWTRSQEVIIEIPSARLKFSWTSAVDVSPLEASATDTALDVWQEE